MEKNERLFSEIKADLEVLKNQNLEKFSIGGWLPKHFVKRFLNYGDTAFSSFIRENQIEVQEHGRRLFVKESSLAEFLNKKRGNS
jgi:hypothetical protein